MKIDPRAESSRESAPGAADQARQPTKPVEKAEKIEKVLKFDRIEKFGKIEKPASDAVQLSGEMRLADEAVRAAAISGDVRPAAVLRARRLLLTGDLGRDTETLAERIIDSLIQSRDSTDPH